MTSPTLDPYREEIVTRLRQGQSKAKIWHTLEREHGIKISKSRFYAFMEEFTEDAAPETEEEPTMFPSESKAPTQSPVDEKVQAFFTELPLRIAEVRDNLATVMDWLVERNTEALQRDTITQSGLHQLRETLSGVSQQLEALREQPRQTRPATPPEKSGGVSPATLRQIWKRAFIVNGIVWGLLVVLFVLGYWWPLWNLATQLVKT